MLSLYMDYTLYAESIKEYCIELYMGTCSVDRALARIGNAHMKKDEPKEAIFFYNKSLAEHRDPDIVKKTLQACHKLKVQNTIYLHNRTFVATKYMKNSCVSI